MTNRKKPSYKFNKLDKKMGFGEYRDNTIQEVIDSQPGFIRWAMDNVTGFNISGKVKSYWEKDNSPIN